MSDDAIAGGSKERWRVSATGDWTALGCGLRSDQNCACSVRGGSAIMNGRQIKMRKRLLFMHQWTVAEGAWWSWPIAVE
jgi:hypothetical protein